MDFEILSPRSVLVCNYVCTPLISHLLSPFIWLVFILLLKTLSRSNSGYIRFQILGRQGASE